MYTLFKPWLSWLYVWLYMCSKDSWPLCHFSFNWLNIYPAVIFSLLQFNICLSILDWLKAEISFHRNSWGTHWHNFYSVGSPLPMSFPPFNLPTPFCHPPSSPLISIPFSPLVSLLLLQQDKTNTRESGCIILTLCTL